MITDAYLKEAAFDEEVFETLKLEIDLDEIVWTYDEFIQNLVDQIKTSADTDLDWERSVRHIIRRSKTRRAQADKELKRERAEAHRKLMEEGRRNSELKAARHEATMNAAITSWNVFAADLALALREANPDALKRITFSGSGTTAHDWLEIRESKGIA